MFNHLDLPVVPVATELTRTGTDDLSQRVANYAVVVKILDAAGYGGFLS